MTERTSRKRSAPARRKSTSDIRPADYPTVLEDIKRLIADSRRRALSVANRELVLVYWQIGAVIARQQEDALWGDGVVVQLAADLRAEFSDMKGLSRSNVFQMRRFVRSCRDIDDWLRKDAKPGEVATKQNPPSTTAVQTASGLLKDGPRTLKKVQTVSGLVERNSSDLAQLIPAISWSRHAAILTRCDSPAERFFYIKMAVQQRWSVRELRRQIDSSLFARYVSVGESPEKCLPAEVESGALLPFRDLLFFHRQLQCLIAIELKKGKFKPEHAGKSRFYCAALDEFIKLPHENPTLGLVLCRSADAVQVRLALTDAAKKIGVATYQTALPDEAIIRRRIEQLPELPEPGMLEEEE